MRFFTVIFVLLLAYIIAAITFWGFSLHKQSEKIYEQELIHLRTQMDSVKDADLYRAEVAKSVDRKSRRDKQYMGEGSTFLFIIFIGAAVVYSSFRRSISLSKQQNNFMLSVTHELKSPIAAMKLNLQTLEKYQLDEQKKNVLIDKCIIESNRLNDLCNNMLLASQMEGRQYKPSKEKLNFPEFVTGILKSYTARYPGRFEVAIDASSREVFIDKAMMEMAINNLLENALKYAPADKPIKIIGQSTASTEQLRVIDEGIGVPDAEKNKIFQKFYRIGNENTRKSKGTGLGLYLALKILKQHKGKIAVQDNQPSGAIFEIQIPQA